MNLDPVVGAVGFGEVLGTQGRMGMPVGTQW
jgi:hypothetical protein